MPAGGKLSIHMKNVVLDEIHAGKNPEAKPGPYVAITVADNGTGIPKEIQDKIFEPFFTTKAPGRGTGLGLATCLGIIKSHGGFINFDSEAGKGSVFKVFLPANVTSVEMKGLVLEQSKMPCGHDELVLVVDDEEAIREVAQKILERFGYRVLTAVNGAEAVSIYQERQHEIAVVITDMAMPVMDGPAAINALQAINPRIRIIGASGLDTENGMAKAQAAGVKHFIPKPHTTEVLLHTLHQVLHQPAAGNFPVN
jgi:CheY-like chemotaxis protein